MRVAIFIVIFGLVLAFTTATHDHGGLAFGWHSFSSYGWPQPWLRVHTIQKPQKFTRTAPGKSVSVPENGVLHGKG